MADKTWITLSKNGVVDKVFEQNGKPESLQMTNLDTGTQYVAQAGLESDGLQSLALQTATFTTLQAGAITVAYVSHERVSSTDTVVYSYTSTYAPSAAVLASTIGGVTTNYQGVIDSNNHRITFTITNWTVGQTYSVTCRLDDIYGETATSAATSITVEETDWKKVPFFVENNGQSSMTLRIACSSSTSNIPDLQKSTDGTNWTTVTLSGSNNNDFEINPSERLYFRGNNSGGFSRSTSSFWRFVPTGYCTASLGGNIMSLINRSNYGTSSVNAIPNNSFYKMFTDRSYQGMGDLSRLTFGYAATVGNYACYEMFGWTTGGGGTQNPSSPPDTSSFTTIGDFGCYGMMSNTKIQSPLDLSNVTTVGNSGLAYSHAYCTNLTRGCDFTRLTSTGTYGLRAIFLNCTGLTTAARFGALTSIGNSGFDKAYKGCTSLTEGSDIHSVTSMDTNGISYMYDGCTLLSTAYYPSVGSTSAANYWLKDCSASGTVNAGSQAAKEALEAAGTYNSILPSGWSVVIQTP